MLYTCKSFKSIIASVDSLSLYSPIFTGRLAVSAKFALWRTLCDCMHTAMRKWCAADSFDPASPNHSIRATCWCRSRRRKKRSQISTRQQAKTVVERAESVRVTKANSLALSSLDRKKSHIRGDCCSAIQQYRLVWSTAKRLGAYRYATVSRSYHRTGSDGIDPIVHPRFRIIYRTQ
jgi:hypothetical protein